MTQDRTLHLRADSTPWLLASAEPVVRYRTLVDVQCLFRLRTSSCADEVTEVLMAA